MCYEFVKVITYAGNETTPASTSAASAKDKVYIQRPYTGTSSITAPITTTIPSEGDEAGTIDVQTPVTDPSEQQYTTIYTPDTGTPPITAPVTTTIPPTGTEPGTVLITTPTSAINDRPIEPSSSSEETAPPAAETTFPPPTTNDQEATAGSTTREITPSQPILPTTTIADPPGNTFDCDAGGFLIQQKTLYRLNLRTGDNPVLESDVGPARNINALGYNIKDNFLYGFTNVGTGQQQQLIRIDATGDAILLPLTVPSGLNVGDIDDNGQFWVSSRGTRWLQVDLDPDSVTFAQQIDEGQSSGVPVADWAFLENGGRYLYSIKLGAGSVAVRWSMDTHEYEELRDYGDVVPGRSGFGALYAVGDELWGSDNQSGDIIAFPILSDSAPARKITDGPTTSSNDGARCFRAPLPEDGIAR